MGTPQIFIVVAVAVTVRAHQLVAPGGDRPAAAQGAHQAVIIPGLSLRGSAAIIANEL